MYKLIVSNVITVVYEVSNPKHKYHADGGSAIE